MIVKFKHTSEISKKGPVMIFTGEMVEYGDEFSVEGEFLINKARLNDNCEEIEEIEETVIDESDDGEEIRTLARSSGIKNVGNKSIETLLKELKELEQA